MRRFIFGDYAIEEWPPLGAGAESHPWPSFVQARAAFDRGATAEAVAMWQVIASDADLESRQVLQAWHFLRLTGGEPPSEIAQRVLGVVAEVAVPGGHDLLATYADGSVRYLNYSGAVAVVEERVPTIDAPARELMGIGQTIVGAIGPWKGPLPPLPNGHSRITMLTPVGPHIGQGPDAALRADRAAATFFDAATRTLVAVVELLTHGEE